MKGFLEKYRNISVWLSLFILAMWFVGASDQENRMPCMLLAFLAGAGIFGSGCCPGVDDGQPAGKPYLCCTDRVYVGSSRTGRP